MDERQVDKETRRQGELFPFSPSPWFIFLLDNTQPLPCASDWRSPLLEVASRVIHIFALVDEMLQLQKEYAAASALREDRGLHLKDRIDEVDGEIDHLVFELYGLTEEEIKTVEGNEE